MKQTKIILATLTTLLLISLIGAELISSPLKKLFNRNDTVLSEVYEPLQQIRGLQVSRIGQGGITAQSLADKLKGAGITISNVQYTGANLAAGSFSGGLSAGFGFTDGAIISSGAASNAIGPNNTASKSTNNQRPGDADLDLLAGDSTFDAAVLEFDFVPQFGQITLNYLLASEEYPEMIDYGDVLAILVDGINIALVPGTATPVSIANLNHLVNSQYYVDNLPAGNNYGAPYTAPWDTQADGFTLPLTAMANVTAGQTHHLKIAIADLGDNVYDSWLLMKEDSFYSAADLAVYLNPPLSPVQGSIAQFHLAAANNGIIAAQNTVVDFRLPLGSTLQSLPAGVTQNSGYYTWAIGTMSPSDSLNLVLNCLMELVPPLPAIAQISSSTPDNNPANDRNLPYMLPIANPNSYTTTEDGYLGVSVLNGLLANDEVYSVAAPQAMVVTDPAHGALNLNANGSFGYDSAPNFNGADSFTYRTFDGLSYSAPTTVSIQVNPTNDPPVLNLWASRNMQEDTPATFDFSTVVSDPDGDPLSISVSNFEHGTWSANGLNVTFTPSLNWFGSDTVTITVSDGQIGVYSSMELIISPVQDISANPSTLDFGNVIVGGSATQRLYIHNAGTTTAMMQAPYFSSNNPAFTFTAPSSYGIAPGGSIFTDVTFSPTANQSYSATFSVYTTVFGESPYQLQLSGSSVSFPEIAVLPSAINESYASGSSNDEILSISNTGEAPLNWSAALSANSPAWQSLSPLSGSIPGGASAQLTLHSDLNGIPAGSSASSIIISSNAANNPQLSIPVDITITGTPLISTTPASIDFGTRYTGQTYTQSLIVQNPGTDVLSLNTSIADPAYSVSPASTSIPAFGQATLTVSLFSTTGGQKNSTLDLVSNAANHPLLQIPLSAMLVIPPTISLSSYEMQVFTIGETGVSRTLQVINSGSEALSWQANTQYQGFSADWLSVYPDTGTIPAGGQQTVNLSFSPLMQNAGLHQAILLFSSNDPARPNVPLALSYYKQDYYATFYDNNNNANYDVPDGDLGQNIVFNSPLNPIEFNIYSNIPEVNYARLVIHASDVEEAQGENSHVSINGYALGILRGESNDESTSIFSVDPAYVVAQGKNLIQIEVDTNEAGDGITVHNAQLVINNMVLDAQIRYVQTEFSSYIAGDELSALIEIDTQLSTQALIVHSSLMTPQLDAIVTTTRSLTISAMVNDAFSETLTIPQGLATGIYYLSVAVYDQATLLQQDMMLLAIQVLPNQARISLSANELDFGIVPSGVADTTPLQISNIGNIPLIISGFGSTLPGISVDPPSATIQPGEFQGFVVSIQEGTLGNYSNTLSIYSNDPGLPVSTVELIAQIIPNEPYISVEPGNLNFGECFTGQSYSLELQITNLGPLTLDVSSLSIANPAYQADVSTFSLGYNQIRQILVSFSTPTPGNFNTELVLSSNAGNAPSLIIPIYTQAELPPQLSLNPAAVTATVVSGETVYPELLISNAGGSFLRWALNENLGKAIHFSGYESSTGEFATIPNRSNIQLATGAFTVSLWAKGESNTGGLANGNSAAGGKQYIISKSSDSVPGFFGIYIDGQDSATQDQNLVLALRNPQGLKELRVNGVISHNQWNHLAAVYSSGTIRLYLNGELIASQAAPGFIGDTAPWILGKLGIEANRYYRFQGALDELRIFDSALSPQFLKQTMYSTLDPLELNLNGYWAFDDANLEDATTANNHGTAQGAVSYPASAITPVPEWIESDPAYGSEPQNTGQNITLALNATGKMAGTYNSQLQLISNDSANPLLQIPIQMNVTGAAALEFNPQSLAFGDVIIGTTKTMDLEIINNGTDLLLLTGISTTNPAFSVPASQLTIFPNDAHVIPISFLGDHEGMFSGTIMMETNVPDMPQVSIPLSGNGALPPVLSYNPASFTQNLEHGAVATQNLNISNSQGLALEYELSLSDNTRSHASGVYYNLTARCKGMTWLHGKLYYISYDDHSLNRYNADTETIEATWPLHAGPYGITSDGNSLYIGSVSGRIYRYTAAGVLINSFTNPLVTFTPTLFYRDNSLYVMNSGISNATIYRISLSGQSLGQYTGSMPLSTQLVYVPDHEPAPYYALQPSQSRIIRFKLGTQSVVVVDTLLVPMGNAYALAHNGRDFYLLENSKNYMTRIDDGLSEFNWISLASSSGSVPAGNSTNVDLAFNARNTFAGSYMANLLLTTNDPSHPQQTLPIQMNVSGQPQLAYDPLSLDYGICYLGYPTTLNVHLENNGGAPLNISAISASLPFSCVFSSLVIDPWQSFDLPVVYTPTALGMDSGALLISTNDPGNLQVNIALGGTCTEAPHLVVNPAQISETLYSDQQLTTQLQVQNTGITPLTFTVDIDPSASRSQELSSPQVTAMLSTGDTSPERLLGDYLAQYPVLAFNYGAVSVNDTLYVISSLTAEIVMQTLQPQQELARYPIHSDPYGIAWDGTNFWVGDQNGTLYKYPKAALHTGSLNIPTQPLNTGIGAFPAFCFDNGDLIVANAFSGTTPTIFRRYTTAGMLLSEYYGTIRNISQLTTIAQHDANQIWAYQNIVTDEVPTGGKLLKLNLSGNLASIAMSRNLWDNALTYTLAHDGNDFLIGDIDGPLMRYDDEIWLGSIISGLSLASGASINIPVKLSPAGINGGAYSGTVYINSNDPANPHHAVPVLLQVTGYPEIGVNPVSAVYDTTLIGQSRSKNFTITNQGNDTLVITSILSDHADFSANLQTLSIPAHGSRNISITFAPTTEAMHNATVTISSNATASPQYQLSLSGFGLLPRANIVVEPSQYDFGGVYTNATRSHSFIVRNTGTAALTVTGIQSSTGAFTTTHILPFVVGIGAQEPFVVRFSPTVVGAYQENFTIISTSDPNPQYVLPLSGTGLQPLPEISVIPAALDYGTVVVTIANTLSLRIVNSGQLPLVVSNISSALPGVSSELGNFTLAAGQYRDIQISLIASAPGSIAGVLQIASNDPDNPILEVPIVAMAIQGYPAITATPIPLNFGSVVIGQSSSQVLSIRNTGNLPLVLNSILPSLPVYTVSHNSATLAPQELLELTVTYTPTQASSQNAVLLIRNNTPTLQNFQVALNGSGQHPVYYTVSPEIIDEYSNVVTTISRTLTLSNTSPGVLNYQLSSSDSAPWLSFNPTSGSLTPGNNAIINLVINTAGLNFDLYETELLISSNSQSMPARSIPIYLNYSNHNITSNDNEDNFGSGNPDNDMDIPISYANPLAPVEFNIFTDAVTATNAQLRIVHQGLLPGELSKVYFNNQYLGNLASTPGNTQESHFQLPPAYLITGTENPNNVRISMDETHVHPAGTTILLGELAYNEIFQNAAIVSLAAEPDMVTPDTLLTILESVSTNLYTQTVRIETRLYNSSDQLQLNPISRMVNLSAYQNTASVATWNLANQVLPGAYHVIVDVYDANSNQLQDSQRLDFYIRPDTPALTLGTTDLDFGTVFVGYAETQELVVNNLGAAPLYISNLHFSNVHFSTPVTTLSIPPSSSVNIPITVNLLGLGAVNATLTITSNDPLYPNTVVTLQATAIGAPIIAVAPPAIAITMLQYQTNTQELTISNTGLSNLELSGITLNNLSWASYSLPTSQIAPGNSTTLSISFNSTGLDQGLYLGSVLIASNDPAHGVIDIPVTVDITPIPVIAEFSADSLSGASPLMVQFTSEAYSTDGSTIISWEWDFDNNGSVDSNQTHPSYTYSSPGSYSVRLRVQTDNGSEHQLIKPNYIYVINNSPVVAVVIPEFNLNEDSLLENFDLGSYFSDPDNDPLSYSVSGSTNLSFVITGSLLAILPAADYNGSEQITITADDGHGASTSQMVWVHVIAVNDPPSFHDLPAEFSYLRGTSFTVDFAQYIHDADTDSTLITISISGNVNTAYTIAGQVVTFVSQGVWFGSEVVTVTINDNVRRETASASLTLTVLDGLNATFYAVPTEVFAGIPVQFYNTTLGNPTHFEWDFENDGIVNSTDPNPQFVYNLGGFYSVRLKVMFIAGTDTLHTGVLIRPDYIHVIGTHVPGGDLLNDWVLAGSPYNITGPVVIPPTSSPTWSTNVDVNILDPSVYIKVEGSLSATNIDINTLNTDRWIGFIVEPDAGNISLTDVRINNAETPLLLRSDATIQDCTIQKDSLVTFVDEWAVKISNAGDPDLIDIQIDDYANGLLIESPTLASQPTLSNIRVRNSTNSIRTEGYGLKVTGKAAPIINNLIVEDFAIGAYYEGDGQALAAPVLISNIRVRNSTNSIRTLRKGIWIKDLMNSHVEADSIINCESGLIIENTLPALAAQTTLSNIRVRNSTNSIRTPSQGIYISGNVRPNLSDIDLDDYTNGLVISGTNTPYATQPLISNIRVRNSTNSIREPEQNGVGIYLWNLLKVSMVNDSIYGYPQGIKIENSMPTLANQPTLSNIRVRNSTNSIRNYGTGIYAGPAVQLILKNSFIYDFGVGVSLYGNDAQIFRNRFLNNDNALLVLNALPGFSFARNELILATDFPTQTASAIKAVNLSGITLNNNTIINYPALLWAENSDLAFLNNIGWGALPMADPFINSNSTLAVHHNDIHLPAGTYPGLGNINADPMFVSSVALDHHLTYNSPCIDSGDPAWQADEDNSIADMGAFVYLHEAAFTSDMRFVTPGTTIQFTDLSAGHPTGESTYAWDFNNDGVTDSNLQNPSFTFNDLGRYHVELIVSSGALTDSLLLLNYILVQSSQLPAPQNVRLFTDRINSILTWDPVTSNITGSPITPNFYIVYSSPQPFGQFRYVGQTDGPTTYTHLEGAVKGCMFYIVIAFTGSRAELEEYLLRKPYIEIKPAEPEETLPERQTPGFSTRGE